MVNIYCSKNLTSVYFYLLISLLTYQISYRYRIESEKSDIKTSLMT